MKQIYWKRYKRKFKKGGILFAGQKFKRRKRYCPDPAKPYALSWLEGMSVTIEVIGDKPKDLWLKSIYLLPTEEEMALCGFDSDYIEMRRSW